MLKRDSSDIYNLDYLSEDQMQSQERRESEKMKSFEENKVTQKDKVFMRKIHIVTGLAILILIVLIGIGIAIPIMLLKTESDSGNMKHQDCGEPCEGNILKLVNLPYGEPHLISRHYQKVHQNGEP